MKRYIKSAVDIIGSTLKEWVENPPADMQTDTYVFVAHEDAELRRESFIYDGLFRELRTLCIENPDSPLANMIVATCYSFPDHSGYVLTAWDNM